MRSSGSTSHSHRGTLTLSKGACEEQRAAHEGRPLGVDLTPDLARLLQRRVAWLKAEKAAPRVGRARVAFPQRGRQALDESRVRKAFQTRARPHQAPRLPRLRSPAHVRELASGGRRADHVRERAARPRQSLDDAALLREVDPEQRAAVGRLTGSRDAMWNHAYNHKSALSRIGGSRYLGTPRFVWWAVGDSNPGPAD